MMYEYRGKIIKVVDGDTVDIEFDLGFHLKLTERVRLLGIDTPERGEPGWTEATNFVRLWVENMQPYLLTIRTVKDMKDKYGRYLAEINAPAAVSGGTSLNKALLDAGLAKIYG